MILTPLLFTLVVGQGTQKPPEAKPEDVKSVDAIVASLYDVISGPANKKRDWNRMRTLFSPQARMVAIVPTVATEAAQHPMTPEDYITKLGPLIETQGFFEKEIHRTTDAYGQIAQIFSTYETRAKADDEKPTSRGINAIQVWNDGKRWWITSVIWQSEDARTPLPEKYLKGNGALSPK